MNSKKIKKIRAIEKQVPQEWRDKLMVEEYVAPDLRAEAENSLREYEEEGLTNTKDYLRLKHLWDAGYYDAKEHKVDPIYAKKIEDFVEKGIQKAIKNGELPKPSGDKELQDYIKKLHRGETRKQKRSIRTKQEAEANGS